MNLEYYSAKDIAEKLGCCLAKAYECINKMNSQLEEEHPNVLIIEHKIPIWYWNLRTKPLITEVNKYEKQKKNYEF